MNSEIDIAFTLLSRALMGTDDCTSTQSLSHSATLPLSTNEWWSLFRLMQKNHVAALTAKAMSALDVPREVKIPWLTEYDKAIRWHRYQQEVQQEIVELMRNNGIETLVLKGTHTAQYYLRPEEREFGDLDLYFYDRHDEADRVARKALKVAVSNDAHHHSKYNYRGVTVESHYDFVNTHYPPSNRRYEMLLKEMAPSPTFEVLFLLRHMACHFAASRLTLRDLVDWTLTCHALESQVDWATVQKTVGQYGMTSFVYTLNSVAGKRLGYQPPMNLSGSRDDLEIAGRLEHDIVYGSTDTDDRGTDGMARLGWKLHRWRALGWKRRMVFNDAPLRLLLASLTSHAEKPQSILHKQ